jgi:predicted MPP superfamily phosphohydrolase
VFFRIVFSGLFLMSLYVGWRTGAVPRVRRWLPWYARAVLLAALGSSLMAAEAVDEAGWPLLAWVLAAAGAYWLGILLLLTVGFLAADLLTVFGLIFRRHLTSIRTWALAAGLTLSAIALVQGNRPPVVREHEVRLPGLRHEDDGLVLAFVSDTHLGTMIGKAWLERLVARVSALQPDLIVLGGDIVEGDAPSERELLPTLRGLRAPLGVCAVAGNHDRFGRGDMLQAMEAAGVRVLRNEWTEIRQGLAMAGVEGGRTRRPNVAGSLAGRPAGAATVLISHAPAAVEEAARAGVGLMLAGHTHDGQIWPFRYVVRTQFRHLAGRYDVGGMSLIVSRGAGTWGPRMRLWLPGEILKVTLRAAGRRTGAPRPPSRP